MSFYTDPNYPDPVTAGDMSREALPFITHIICFGRKLHDAGIDVNPSNLIDLSRSLLYIDIANYEDFYAAALATLIINREDMELFALLFREYWQNLELPFEDELSTSEETDGNGAAESQAMRRQLQPADGDAQDDAEEQDTESEQIGYSSHELLVRKDIDAMSDAELEQARKIIAEFDCDPGQPQEPALQPGKIRPATGFQKNFPAQHAIR